MVTIQIPHNTFLYFACVVEVRQELSKMKNTNISLSSEYCQSNATYPTVPLIKKALNCLQVRKEIRAARAVTTKMTTPEST